MKIVDLIIEETLLRSRYIKGIVACINNLATELLKIGEILAQVSNQLKEHHTALEGHAQALSELYAATSVLARGQVDHGVDVSMPSVSGPGRPNEPN